MKTATIIINIIFILLLLPGAGMAVMSPMMFDAPGSTENKLTILTATSIFTFPIVIIIAQIISWIFFANGNYKVAFWIALLPVVNITLITIGFTLIQILQGGRFTT